MEVFSKKVNVSTLHVKNKYPFPMEWQKLSKSLPLSLYTVFLTKTCFGGGHKQHHRLQLSQLFLQDDLVSMLQNPGRSKIENNYNITGVDLVIKKTTQRRV